MEAISVLAGGYKNVFPIGYFEADGSFLENYGIFLGDLASYIDKKTKVNNKFPTSFKKYQ